MAQLQHPLQTPELSAASLNEPRTGHPVEIRRDEFERTFGQEVKQVLEQLGVNQVNANSRVRDVSGNVGVSIVMERETRKKRYLEAPVRNGGEQILHTIVADKSAISFNAQEEGTKLVIDNISGVSLLQYPRGQNLASADATRVEIEEGGKYTVTADAPFPFGEVTKTATLPEDHKISQLFHRSIQGVLKELATPP